MEGREGRKGRYLRESFIDALQPVASLEASINKLQISLFSLREIHQCAAFYENIRADYTLNQTATAAAAATAAKVGQV